MKKNKISQRYTESTIHNIYEIYQKHDSKKFNRWHNAMRKMNELDGWGLKVIDYNSYNFSCAFLFLTPDKKTKLYYYALNNSEAIYNYTD